MAPEMTISWENNSVYKLSVANSCMFGFRPADSSTSFVYQHSTFSLKLSMASSSVVESRQADSSTSDKISGQKRVLLPIINNAGNMPS